jgi:hypothetical protein
MMRTAFQVGAFQANAFQVVVTVPPPAVVPAVLADLVPGNIGLLAKDTRPRR